jgi:NAD(P)-dependent dehydrogenase (short-subunit alcohol dehydrogenase family)
MKAADWASERVWDDINFERRDYDPWAAYGQSKTANALFAVGMTHHHKAAGITSNGLRKAPLRRFRPRSRPNLKASEAATWRTAQSRGPGRRMRRCQA